MDMMEIKPYTETDDIKGLVRRATESVDPDKYSRKEHLERVIPEMTLDFVDKNRFLYFRAVKKGEFLGLAGLQRESGTVAGIFVEPAHKREGVGSRLLERLEQEVEEGLTKMRTLVSLEAIDFYRKNNYEGVEETESEIKGENIPILIMEKEL